MVCYEHPCTFCAMFFFRVYSNNFFFWILVLDPKAIIKEFLSLPQVVAKNKDGRNFDNSIHVFIEKKQTPVEDGDQTLADVQMLAVSTPQSPPQPKWEDICSRLQAVKAALVAARKDTLQGKRDAARYVFLCVTFSIFLSLFSL